jgi:hypothetical protein
VNNTIDTMEAAMTGGLDDTNDEDLGPLLDPRDESAAPDAYPRLWNMSAGFIFKAMVLANEPTLPEYVTVPLRRVRDEENLKLLLAVINWNIAWEAAQFRPPVLRRGGVAAAAQQDRRPGRCQCRFVPRTESRYHEYAPLFHLLPRAALERHGLPLLSGGQWPFFTQLVDIDRFLPADFQERLARAWAGTPTAPSRSGWTTSCGRRLASA